MKSRYAYYILLGLIPMTVVAGAVPDRSKKVTVNPVKTLTPDSTSAVNVDVMINVPAHAFSSRSRLIIVPQLISNDTMVSECRAMVLDAPIYSKKMKRRVKLEGYVDTLAENSGRVNNRENQSIPYIERVSVPENIDGGRIIAVLSTDGCGECEVADTVDMAYIANLPTLIEPKKSLQLNWIEPEFVVKPKVMQGKGEALLQFVINRHDINLSLGNNEKEMNTMLSVLEKIVNDSLATLNSVSIYGMASADGSFAFNTTLSRNRANSAKKWLVSQLGISQKQADEFSIGSRPEGWLPVLEAMRADGHKDTLKVKEILDKYNAENDDVAERYIRRLACWNDIKNRYLQKDRKVEYEYTYTIKSFTSDEELLSMYSKRPDAFNEEELLRVSVLKQTPEEKKEVYRTILRYFPQSKVAANNLAVLLLREDKVDEAEQVINSVEGYTPEIINTKAAVYVYKNDYERAIELLQTDVTLPEAKYNLGIIKASARQLDEAYELLKDYRDTNAAVVALSVNRNTEAYDIMSANEDTTSRAEYVRSLVFARRNEANNMLSHLENAVVEEIYRNRARTEADFMPYARLDEFIILINNGGHNNE